MTSIHTVAGVLLLCLCFSSRAPAQQSSQPQQTQEKDSQANQPTTDKKTRVYITDSQSWQVSGAWGASGGSGGGATTGGARPQTAEIIKTFGERCPELTVTNNKDKANYVVLLDHEGGKGALRHKNKVAVFNREGDSIFSGSTLSLGGSVNDACNAIRKDAGIAARAKSK